MTMLAYHNDPAIKATYIARVRAHRAADELIQGIGWERGRGCAVGCTLDAYYHARYPVELGVPIELAYLEDQLFELLEPQYALAWPERFLEAIPVGADLSGVWSAWAQWMLADPVHGVIRYAGERDNVHAAIDRIAELYRVGGTSEQFLAAYASAAAVRAVSWAEEDATATADAAAWAARAAARAAEVAAWAAETSEIAAWTEARAAADAADAAAYASARGAAWTEAAAAADAAAYASARGAAGTVGASSGWTLAACDELVRLLAAAPISTAG